MHKANKGFTLVEIVIIITVISILATIGVVSFINIQKFTRDKQRYNQITIIGEALEKYYDQNGSYPTCDDANKILETQPTTLLDSTDEKVFQTPTNAAPSIQCVTSISGTDDKFYYVTDVSGVSDGWELKYYSELDKNISGNVIKNRRQYTTLATSTPANYNLGISILPDVGGTVDNSGGQYSANTNVTLTALANTGWEFNGWSNCSTSASATITITMNNNKNCVANFRLLTPTMTNVTASTVVNNTTWSWSDVICPSLTTAEYHYWYYTSKYDSKWQPDNQDTINDSPNYTASGTSYLRSTYWQGYDYTVKVQAKCKYDDTIQSDWSDEKQAVYTRDLIAPGDIAMTLYRGTSGSTYTNNSAMIRFRSTCSGGADMIIKYDAKQADIYRWNLEKINPATGDYYRGQWWREYQNRLGNGFKWLSYTNYPIYPDPSRDHVVAIGWLKWLWGYSITIFNSIDNVPTESGSGWGALVVAKCTANGRYSSERTFSDTNVYVGKNP